MKTTYIHNGKKRRADRLPNGLYNCNPPDYIPVLVDAEYNGFRMVFGKEEKIKKSFGVITDTMDGTRNPVDGKMYDSKSRYYQTVKNAGCVIVGDDPAMKTHREKELSSLDRKRDIARAMESL
jgi:hypothetical protein